MAKSIVTYTKLMKMAKDYCVDTNTLFVSAAKTYVQQQELIAKMRTDLEESGLTVAKEYVKGRENLCINPLVTELPKHVDSANRTLTTMLNIITDIGVKPSAPDQFDAFLKGGKS